MIKFLNLKFFFLKVFNMYWFQAFFLQLVDFATKNIVLMTGVKKMKHRSQTCNYLVTINGQVSKLHCFLKELNFKANEIY